MIVYGASGHSKVIIDIIESSEEESIAFVIDDNPDIKEIMDYRVDHSFSDNMKNESVVIAVGNNVIRKKIADNFDFKYVQGLIHKRAVVNRDVSIGDGSVVMAGAVINSSTHIGENCIINTNAVIEHDVEIGDFCHISPGAVITGNVQIGIGSHIGAGASVIPGVKIGKWATIGAGTVVIENIPDHAVVVGNPGKVIKFNKLENEQR